MQGRNRAVHERLCLLQNLARWLSPPPPPPTGMKRIDLICLIASPIAVGLLMTYGGSRPMVTAALAILGWNMAAWVPECALLRYAQRCSPVLRCALPACVGDM